MPSIRENYLHVLERIDMAARRVGRKPQEVQLVAVSKTVDADRVREAVEAGVKILGENYVQEAQKKIEALGRPVRWHLIGHLQSNKAKIAVQLFDLIHSLDRLSLAEALNQKASSIHRVLKVFIEVNLSGEATKFGTDEGRFFTLARRVSEMDHLSLEGLMTMPPYSDTPEDSRPYFRELRKWKERMNQEGIPLKELSMGMSNDFEIAVEEGATYVRVGTAIFGPRK